MRYLWVLLLAGLVLALVGAFRYVGADDEVVLQAGDPAPAFSLQGSDGARHSLAESRGRAVVLAWFPKAFTGG